MRDDTLQPFATPPPASVKPATTDEVRKLYRLGEARGVGYNVKRNSKIKDKGFAAIEVVNLPDGTRFSIDLPAMIRGQLIVGWGDFFRAEITALELGLPPVTQEDERF